VNIWYCGSSLVLALAREKVILVVSTYHNEFFTETTPPEGKSIEESANVLVGRDLISMRADSFMG
jgi:hypothetical protein